MSTKSSNTPEPPRVELRPSRCLQAALIALAIFVAAALFHAALPPVLSWTLVVALSIHLVHSLRREADHRGCLSWRGEHWSWRNDAGAEQMLHLQQATVWRALIALRFREPSGRSIRTFALLPDSAARDAQRRLRMWLRHMPVFERMGEGVDEGAAAMTVDRRAS